jgi:PPM family protein phosphatase
MYIMIVAAKSDIGRVRQNNEDSLLIDAQLGLLIVADGMGGHAGGEVASVMAVDMIAAYIKGSLAGPESADQRATLLQAAIRTADQAIWNHAHARRDLRDMGTTAVVALCQEDQVHIAHVGDSRAYLLHDGELRQLTEDHSVVAQLIRTGQLTPRRARVHPLRHQITRYLGSRDAVAELCCVAWQRGDYLLLCSDGLTNMVQDHDIETLIRHGGTDVQAICAALVGQANVNGGEDNISVILAYRD